MRVRVRVSEDAVASTMRLFTDGRVARIQFGGNDIAQESLLFHEFRCSDAQRPPLLFGHGPR
ncbi:hypothetical protein SVTN_03905 [Streptomyces vietnamensis]|uniref:Uncharacterized protein n=1 Tax=Streptomyces vietnamensis TaxID=362257 RepID=A0A0B5HZN7_9ACTN|nr:hypothetical protein SVTN_03905 [Streptomyces vietnamensis]